MTQKKKTAAKVSPYTGLLAEPWPVLPWRFNAGDAPRWAEGGISNDDWGYVVEQIEALDRQRFLRCYELLYEHFDIDRLAPAAAHRLVFALAFKHVPAFQSFVSVKEQPSWRTNTSGAPTKLDHIGTVIFVVEAEKFRERVHNDTGRQPSDRDVAKHLSKLPVCTDCGLDFESIRPLLRQAKQARSAYLKGEATQFQRQLIQVAEMFLSPDTKNAQK
jgi:hypothetical protein